MKLTKQCDHVNIAIEVVQRHYKSDKIWADDKCPLLAWALHRVLDVPVVAVQIDEFRWEDSSNIMMGVHTADEVLSIWRGRLDCPENCQLSVSPIIMPIVGDRLVIKYSRSRILRHSLNDFQFEEARLRNFMKRIV
jgi:hypothetical protein